MEKLLPGWAQYSHQGPHKLTLRTRQMNLHTTFLALQRMGDTSKVRKASSL